MRVQTRLTQQEIIKRYIQDHQEDWETKSECTQQRFIDDLEATTYASSDTESETLYAEVMSQPGSSRRNTPTPGPSMITSGPAPTLADLTRVVMDLGVTVGHIITQLNTLTQQVTLATSTRPQATKVAVARPKAWNGKEGSVEARHFLAAFVNYTGNEGDTLNSWDPVGNMWIQNDKRWIAAVLNLMEEEART